jgi:hypothetical protein
MALAVSYALELCGKLVWDCESLTVGMATAELANMLVGTNRGDMGNTRLDTWGRMCQFSFMMEVVTGYSGAGYYGPAGLRQSSMVRPQVLEGKTRRAAQQ